MKKLVTLIVVALYTQLCFAQAPQGFSYQAIARDNNGNPKASTNVSVKFSILSGSAQGSAVYEETQQTQSNSFGLFTLTIGQGTATTGTFSAIDWAGPKFLKVEIDGTLSSTTQLLSVPYALYAEKTKPDLKAGTGIAVAGNEISNTGDLSTTNELQTLSISGNTISLSNSGGSVNLPSVRTSHWRDTTVDVSQVFSDRPVLVGQKGGIISGFSFIATQTSLDVSRNQIALFSRNYGNVGANLGIYAYPDSPEFPSYLRGYSLLYSPVGNRGIELATVGANGTIRFHTGGFSSANTERMTIANNGNIGMGVIAPTAKLQVAGGDVYLQDTFRGVIMRSPDGSCWRMTVSNAGAPVMTKIDCP